MIELRKISAQAGAFSLRNVDLKIDSGQCHVIVGPTGAGKTFLIETLLGLRNITSGQVLANESDISTLAPHKRKIAYVPQDNCLFPNMTVAQNIGYGLQFCMNGGKETQELIEHLAGFLKIRHLFDRWPGNLSGGEKQRVALARALVTRPSLLALDEPFSAIDQTMREDIRRLLKELLEEFKTTTLIVTHDHDEAFFFGDQLSIMINGEIIQTGPREQMYYYPKTAQAAEFLGMKNIFRARAIEVDPDHVVIDWYDMQTKMTIPCHCSQKRFKPGQDLFFGIRSELVFVIRPGFENKPGFYLFDANVKKFYRRGRNHTLIAEIISNKKLIFEIDIHDVAAKKLEICEGKKITISLEPRRVFLYSA